MCCVFGTQEGYFAEGILKENTQIERYHLVDLWEHQDNYIDYANVEQEKQDTYLLSSVRRLRPYRNKTIYHIGLTSEGVTHLDEKEVDFLYVDARHDYCGVLEDLQLYFPKMAVCSFMAGHDYHTAAEVPVSSKIVYCTVVYIL